MSIFIAPLRHPFAARANSQSAVSEINQGHSATHASAQDTDDQDSDVSKEDESEQQDAQSAISDDDVVDEDDDEQATPTIGEPLSQRKTGKQHRSLRYQHIDVLVTLLHRSILDSDWPHAEHAYALLLRCKGVDIRLCYGLGLEILENVDPTGNKAAEFLSRLIVAYPPIRPRRGKVMYDRAEKFVPLLVDHRLKHQQYKVALQELDSWLLVPPYKDDQRLWTRCVEVCAALIVIATNDGNREEVARLTRKRENAVRHLSE